MPHHPDPIEPRQPGAPPDPTLTPEYWQARLRPLSATEPPLPLRRLLTRPQFEDAARVLSRLAGTRRNKRCSDLVGAGHALLRCGRTGLPSGGVVQESPFAGLQLAIPAAEKAFARLGLGRLDLVALYEQACHDFGAEEGVLDPLILLAAFPAPLWRVIAFLAQEGRQLAEQRLFRMLFELRADPVRVTRAKRSTRRGQGSLDQVRTGALMIARGLHALDRDGLLDTGAGKWQAAPVLGRLLSTAPSETSAPHPDAPRNYWARCEAGLADLLGPRWREDPVGAVDRLTRAQLMGRQAASVKDITQDLLTLLFGGRDGAVRALCWEDFVLERSGPDGELTAGVAIYPGKSREPEEASWKNLPADAAAVVLAHRELQRRRYELWARRGWLPERTPNGRLIPRTGRMPEDFPLFPGTLTRPWAPITASSTWERRAGRPAQGDRPGRIAPMLHPGARGELGMGPSSHPWRAWTTQAIEVMAPILRRQGRLRADIDGVSAAEALLDQAVTADRLGYADIAKPGGRERYSQIAIQLVWEFITTDAAAERAPDAAAIARGEDEVARIRCALEAERAARAALQRRLEDDTQDRAQVAAELVLSAARSDDLREELDTLKDHLVALRHDESTFIVVGGAQTPLERLRASAPPPADPR